MTPTRAAKPDAGRRKTAVASALIASATLAQSQVIDLEWTAAGAFERQVSVAPGKFAELCGALAKGQSVKWTFEAAGPLDFNIHYHQGKDVIYPAQASGTARSEGTLVVDSAQDYCWMWTNKSAGAVGLKVKLSRR
ncbi:MAG: hypothetical protein KDG44_12300 [Burkholderiaceae bacterium]|nr:hypothetical protein [Burkholderiaceae bacterium]